MKLIVFGATGGTGRALVEQGLAAGHDVAAFVRNPDRLRVTGEPEVIQGDLADAAAVERALRGRDVVLSGLGTRPWRHQDICSEGTRAIVAGMRAAGVRRIVVLSSMGVGDSRLGFFGGLFAKLVIRRALRDKGVMEDELAAGGAKRRPRYNGPVGSVGRPVLGASPKPPAIATGSPSARGCSRTAGAAIGGAPPTTARSAAAASRAPTSPPSRSASSPPASGCAAARRWSGDHGVSFANFLPNGFCGCHTHWPARSM
jgi:hypothetical protein